MPSSEPDNQNCRTPDRFDASQVCASTPARCACARLRALACGRACVRACACACVARVCMCAREHRACPRACVCLPARPPAVCVRVRMRACVCARAAWRAALRRFAWRSARAADGTPSPTVFRSPSPSRSPSTASRAADGLFLPAGRRPVRPDPAQGELGGSAESRNFFW